MKNDKFKIERGIPLPIKGKYINTLRAMKPGESVVLPTKINYACTFAGRAWGPKSYTAMTIENGIRIWRIK